MSIKQEAAFRMDSRAAFLYAAAVFCYTLQFCFRWANTETLLFVPLPVLTKALLAVTGGLLVLVCLRQRYDLARIVAVPVILALGLASSLESGDRTLLWLVLFVVAGQRADFRLIAKSVLAASLLGMFIVVGSWFCGEFQSAVMQAHGELDGSRVSLGFAHPNNLGAVVLAALGAYGVVRFPRFGVFDVALFAAALVLIRLTSDSRTAMAGIALLAAAFLLACHARGPFWTRLLLLLPVAVLVGVVALSLFMMACYDGSVGWMAALDRLVSGRFSYAHYYYGNAGLTPFGYDFSDGAYSVVVEGEEVDFILDNIYARLVLAHGAIPAACLLLAFLLLFARAVKGRCIAPCVAVLTVMLVVGVADHYALYPCVNIGLLGLSSVLYSRPLAEMDCVRELRPADGRARTRRRRTPSRVLRPEAS